MSETAIEVTAWSQLYEYGTSSKGRRRGITRHLASQCANGTISNHTFRYLMVVSVLLWACSDCNGNKIVTHQNVQTLSVGGSNYIYNTNSIIVYTRKGDKKFSRLDHKSKGDKNFSLLDHTIKGCWIEHIVLKPKNPTVLKVIKLMRRCRRLFK